MVVRDWLVSSLRVLLGGLKQTYDRLQPDNSCTSAAVRLESNTHEDPKQNHHRQFLNRLSHNIWVRQLIQFSSFISSNLTIKTEYQLRIAKKRWKLIFELLGKNCLVQLWFDKLLCRFRLHISGSIKISRIYHYSDQHSWCNRQKPWRVRTLKRLPRRTWQEGIKLRGGPGNFRWLGYFVHFWCWIKQHLL